MEDTILLGSIIKTFGKNGGFIIHTEIGLSSEFENAAHLFIEINGGLVPFFISNSGTTIRDEFTAIVYVDDIETEELAKELIDCRVFVPQNYFPDEEIPEDYNQFAGYKMVDNKKGIIGIIEEMVDIPGNPVFRVLSDNNEILIPVNEDIITEIYDTDKCIHIDAPQGLIELYINES